MLVFSKVFVYLIPRFKRFSLYLTKDSTIPVYVGLIGMFGPPSGVKSGLTTCSPPGIGGVCPIPGPSGVIP